MMAVAGILFTSAMGFTDGKWFLTGSQEFPLPPLALLAIQFPVMGMLEVKRLDGYQATGNVRPPCPLSLGECKRGGRVRWFEANASRVLESRARARMTYLFLPRR